MVKNRIITKNSPEQNKEDLDKIPKNQIPETYIYETETKFYDK